MNRSPQRKEAQEQGVATSGIPKERWWFWLVPLVGVGLCVLIQEVAAQGVLWAQLGERWLAPSAESELLVPLGFGLLRLGLVLVGPSVVAVSFVGLVRVCWQRFRPS